MCANDKKRDRADYALILSAFILWGIHVTPLLWPQQRFWGFNHLQFLSPQFTLFYIAAGLVFAVMLIPRLRQTGQSILDAVASHLFKENSYRPLFFIVPISAAVFWFFRASAHFLGDGYALLHGLGGELPLIVKWSEVGCIKVISWMAELLPFSNLKLAEYAFSLVSICAGGFSVVIFYLLARRLVEDNGERVFLFCLMLGGGWMILFFGYAENYPVLWPVVGAYLYFAIRQLQVGGRLIVVTICLAAAVFMHLQTIFLVPSYVFLLAVTAHSRWPSAVYHRLIAWGGVLGGLVVVGAILWFYHKIMVFRLFFVPFFSRPGTPGYSLFSLPHLIDIANELLLLVPLLPLLLLAAFSQRQRLIRDDIDRLLLLLGAGSLLFLFVIDPKLGMGRDWDLFALSGLGVGLYLGRKTAGLWVRRQLAYPVLFLGALLIFPFYAAVLSRQPAVENYKWLLNLDTPRSRAGMVLLNQYYLDIGDTASATRVLADVRKKFPIVIVGAHISELTQQGKYAEAYRLADSLHQADPYSIEAYNLRGWVHLNLRNYDQAISDLEQSIELGPYDHEIHCNLAFCYANKNNFPRAIPLYMRALGRYPDYLPALEGLTNCYALSEQYDSAGVYAHRAITVNSLSPLGYEVLSLLALQNRDEDSARIYLARYIQLAPESPQKERAKKLLAQLSPADPSSPEQ